jgi:hypothetical protein
MRDCRERKKFNPNFLDRFHDPHHVKAPKISLLELFREASMQLSRGLWFAVFFSRDRFLLSGLWVLEIHIYVLTMCQFSNAYCTAPPKNK